MEEQHRSFLRIPTRLRGRMRLLANENEQQLFREAPITHVSVVAAELKNAGLGEALVNALLSIERKLDLLIGLNSQDNLQADFPHPIDVFEISGAGIKMATDRELAVGQHLEVVLVLTQLPVRMASGIAAVVRREASDGRDLWALDFTRIRDRDLESIVQFVFQAERDELREKKWTKE